MLNVFLAILFFLLGANSNLEASNRETHLSPILNLGIKLHITASYSNLDLTDRIINNDCPITEIRLKIPNHLLMEDSLPQFYDNQIANWFLVFDKKDKKWLEGQYRNSNFSHTDLILPNHSIPVIINLSNTHLLWNKKKRQYIDFLFRFDQCLEWDDWRNFSLPSKGKSSDSKTTLCIEISPPRMLILIQKTGQLTYEIIQSFIATPQLKASPKIQEKQHKSCLSKIEKYLALQFEDRTPLGKHYLTNDNFRSLGI